MSHTLSNASVQQRLRVAGHILLYGSVGTASSVVVYFLQEQIRQVQKLRPLLESKQRFTDALRKHGVSEAAIQRMRKSTLEDHIKELESRGLVKLELVEDPPKWTSSPHYGQMYHVEYVQSDRPRKYMSGSYFRDDERNDQQTWPILDCVMPRRYSDRPLLYQVVKLFRHSSCGVQMRKHWVDRIETHCLPLNLSNAQLKNSLNWPGRLTTSFKGRCRTSTSTTLARVAFYSQEVMHATISDMPPFAVAGGSLVGASPQRHDAIRKLQKFVLQVTPTSLRASTNQSTELVRKVVDKLAQSLPLSSAANEAILLLQESVQANVASLSDIISRLVRHRAYSHARAMYEFFSKDTQPPSAIAEMLFAISELRETASGWNDELGSQLVLDIVDSLTVAKTIEALRVLDSTSRVTPKLLVLMLSSGIHGTKEQFTKITAVLCESDVADQIGPDPTSVPTIPDKTLASAVTGFAALRMDDAHKPILWTRLLELAVHESCFSAVASILQASHTLLPTMTSNNVATLLYQAQLNMSDEQFLATDMRSLLGFFERCQRSIADAYLPDIARRFFSQSQNSNLVGAKYLRQICSALSPEVARKLLNDIPSDSTQLLAQTVNKLQKASPEASSRDNPVSDRILNAQQNSSEVLSTGQSKTANWSEDSSAQQCDIVDSIAVPAALVSTLTTTSQISDGETPPESNDSREIVPKSRPAIKEGTMKNWYDESVLFEHNATASMEPKALVESIMAIASKSSETAHRLAAKASSQHATRNLPTNNQRVATASNRNLPPSRPVVLSRTIPATSVVRPTILASSTSAGSTTSAVDRESHEDVLQITKVKTRSSARAIQDARGDSIDPIWSTSISFMLDEAKHGNTTSCLSRLEVAHATSSSLSSTQAKVQFCSVLYCMAGTATPEAWLDFAEVCVQKYGLFFGPRTFDRVVSRSIRQDEATAAAQLLPRLIKLSAAQSFDVGVRAKTIYRAIAAFTQKAITDDRDREGVSMYHLFKKICKVNERLVSQSLVQKVEDAVEQADVDDEIKMRSFPLLYGQKWTKQEMHRYRAIRLQLRRHSLQRVYNRCDTSETFERFEEIYEEDLEDETRTSQELVLVVRRAVAAMSEGNYRKVVQEFELHLMSGQDINMELLRTATRACLQLEDYDKAEEFCRKAELQKVYAAPAQLLILQQRILNYDNIDHNSIHDMVIDWYRKMAPVHPQVAHAALRAAVTRLTAQHRSAALTPRLEKVNRDAVDLMLEIYDSEWCKKIPFGIKEYTSLMTAYFNCSDLKGVYWTIATILKKNMPITVTFMRILYRESRVVMTRLSKLKQRSAAWQYQLFWRKIIALCYRRRQTQRATTIKLQHAVMNVLLYDAVHPDVDDLVHITASELPGQLDTLIAGDSRDQGLQQLHEAKHIRAQAIAGNYDAIRQAWRATHPDHPDHPLALPDLEMTHSETLSVFDTLADNEILRRKASLETILPSAPSKTAKALPRPRPVTTKWTEQDTRLLALLKRKVKAIRHRNGGLLNTAHHETWDLLQFVREIKEEYRGFQHLRGHQTALEQTIKNKDHITNQYALDGQIWREVMEDHGQVDWARAGS